MSTIEDEGLDRNSVLERIEKLKAEGWSWNLVYVDEQTGLERFSFLPPIGDERRNWCAMWINLDNKRAFPHWMLRD